MTRSFGRWAAFDRGAATIAYDFSRFQYDNYTDLTTGKLYDFNANILQLYLSLWY